METLKAIVVIIYWVAAWISLNYMQNAMGFSLFATFEGYLKIVFMKGLISLLFGWLIIPIALIHKLIKK